jgi:hypothetical protein
MVTSTDGVSWSEVAGAPELTDIAYGNGLWMGVGSAPSDGSAGGQSDDSFVFVTYTSKDGRSWQAQNASVPVHQGQRFFPGSVTYGNDRWVITGTGELGDASMQVTVESSEGTTWTAPDADPTNNVGDIAWNGQLWGQVGGHYFYSRDTPAGVPFAAIGPDLTGWTNFDVSPPTILLNSLICTGDRGWLAAGSDLPLTTSIRPAGLWRSSDLGSWTQVGTLQDASLVSIASFGGPAGSASSCAAPSGTGVAAPTAVPSAESDPTTPAASGGQVPAGDLGLSIPMALNDYPGSSYLRTDQSCPSLHQSTGSGDPIYAVYRPAGRDQGSVCAAVNAAGGSAYGMWLDTNSDPDTDITC